MRIDLNAQNRTLLAGLLAGHIEKNFLTPRVLHLDITKEMQEQYRRARVAAYASALILYSDLGGARRWPDAPARVAFSDVQPDAMDRLE